MELLWLATGALIAGFFVLSALATVLLVMSQSTFESRFDSMSYRLNAETSRRKLAEEDAKAARLEVKAAATAIETGSLPWFPKTEKLEARYENEALDRLENPSFYSDAVDGLGQ